jgi:hypothetical protein
VEPTALALLALESAPGVEAENRRKEALGFIEDRRCPQGGWNVGSPVMFASGLPGRAHSTAWVILALAKTSPGMIRPGDKEFLRAEMRRERGVLGFAWGLLALRAAGEEDREAEDRLRRLQGKNGGWENSPFKTAAAQMALGGQL